MAMLPDEVMIVTMYGELDTHEAMKIRQDISTTILRGDVKTLIWNLDYLQFMDSTGVGLILGRMRELYAVEGQTILLNPSPTMEKIFGYSGLGSFVVHGTEETAILQARGIVNG